MTEAITCARCGSTNPPGSNFCGACGAGLPDTEDSTGSYPSVDAAGQDPGEVPQLVVTRGATAGARYALDSEVVEIGRHPDSEIFLDDVTVSRHHARITTSGEGAPIITDAGSLNGTYVDGERVEAAQLREGAQIQVGKFRLVLVFGTPGSEP
ncbi:MAG: FHA domain-containing protein [Microthrixaceae bacterium]|nr:FHA domain-containing protein [Microthrixaceae bacterium]MCO5319344.1 FHA domain-containing protein [Microthrixaceae bacterium]